ncbi:MAG: hypothetical protein HGA36_03625 [Candidatus Moranbacteria bacterium]|nr:hypothetical protein [Candidatus Moranbacteria bacterium]
MKRKNSITLKLAHELYDPQSIEMAAGAFEELAEIAIVKNKHHTEIEFLSDEGENVLFEFANYALFLTIQSK